jgi:hypothetical protein
MNLDDAEEMAWLAMDNIADMDVTLRMYARAAAKGLGWRDISKEIPAIDDVVVCTDGERRWLDKRTKYQPDMKWDGHTPTHWHPIADVPALSRPNPNDIENK